jgi:integrase
VHRLSQENDNRPEPLLNSAQLADQAGLNESTLRGRVRAGVSDPVPHLRFGRYVRFDWNSAKLQDWIARNKKSSQTKKEGDGPQPERRRRKMRNRHQQGHLFKRSGAWYVRYYDDIVQPNGAIERVQLSRRIGAIKDYPTKAAARQLAEEFLAPINSGQLTAEGSMTLTQFVETIYLPYVEEQLKPSTYAGYRDIWRAHLKSRCGEIRLREFRTYEGEQVLRDIARSSVLGRNTLKHVKTLMSGIFKRAKRQGLLNGVNPIQDVSIPKSKESQETYAYSLEEITRMLAILPQPAGAVVAAAAFTGARRGEVRGFLWENYNGDEIRVTQSVWRGKITEPKTRKSKSPVPVIEPLRAALDAHRRLSGNPTTGLMFKSERGTSLDLQNLARRFRPTLEKAGLKWHGWHAFRRGLATNLYRLGVPDKTIQAILRHANLSTTMNSYVKTVTADAADAMKRLELICTNNALTSASPSVSVM